MKIEERKLLYLSFNNRKTNRQIKSLNEAITLFLICMFEKEKIF